MNNTVGVLAQQMYAKLVRMLPNFGTKLSMLDRFDLTLLNLVQRNDAQTADELARAVPLSPSALARRLRRLRREGWIARTVALLAPRLTERRLRAIVMIQLGEHTDQRGKAALLRRVDAAPQVQFCYELAGAFDLLMLVDCDNMAEFNCVIEQVLEVDQVVRRYETNFVKRETKFSPFVELRSNDPVS
ncbi:Lrp/AsnC family transcriptional regulator [Erythrobacter mangrovi]|uniref:Lrp/AsnC family transcriptional regulator n=1 Tax=Erythrobacter mangrovi TaxID=2739433 RepID=A0A7D3XZR3_9SPHN|nr:Lrp/AsnC family transcriptional regulator [Erythrobacter mangrovi]QKG71192.1 Lrp/AsnC family transcriptional regulator [Erythrobacter mangrovi]